MVGQRKIGFRRMFRGNDTGNEMPQDPFIREKFTRDRTYARKLAAEYFERFPKDRYQTEVESWRELQSQNIEFTMKRLREPIERATEIAK
jgi:hypothetical protein